MILRGLVNTRRGLVFTGNEGHHFLLRFFFLFVQCSLQGTLSEEERTLSTVDLQPQISSILNENFTYIRYGTSHLNKEVNCTEPSPSVCFPCSFEAYKWLLANDTPSSR
jgi:hypothetical protein